MMPLPSALLLLLTLLATAARLSEGYPYLYVQKYTRGDCAAVPNAGISRHSGPIVQDA